jgi:hypothetical protein
MGREEELCSRLGVTCRVVKVLWVAVAVVVLLATLQPASAAPTIFYGRFHLTDCRSIRFDYSKYRCRPSSQDLFVCPLDASTLDEDFRHENRECQECNGAVSDDEYDGEEDDDGLDVCCVGERDDGNASFDEHFCRNGSGCCSLPEFDAAFCVSEENCDSECAQRVGLLSCNQCDQEVSASDRLISTECRSSVATTISFFSAAVLATAVAWVLRIWGRRCGQFSCTSGGLLAATDWILVSSTGVLLVLALLLAVEQTTSRGEARLTLVAYILTPMVFVCAVVASGSFVLGSRAHKVAASSLESPSSSEASSSESSSSNEESPDTEESSERVCERRRVRLDCDIILNGCPCFKKNAVATGNLC